MARTLTNVQNLLEADKALFDLVITDKRTPSVMYDPRDATDVVTAKIQAEAERATGIADIPVTLFNVVYYPALPGATEQPDGKYSCKVPAPLIHIYDTAAPPEGEGILTFVGDEKGNVYKLVRAEHTARKRKDKSKVDHSAPTWFTLTPDANCTKSMPTLRDQTRIHLNKFGMTLIDDPEAFKPLEDKHVGQSKQGAFHVAYEVDWFAIPRIPGGYEEWDIHGVKSMQTDETEYATLWTKPENIKSLFHACPTCWKPVANVPGKCLGHGSSSSGKMPADLRRAQAAQNDQNAKRRKATKAAQTFGF